MPGKEIDLELLQQALSESTASLAQAGALARLLRVHWVVIGHWLMAQGLMLDQPSIAEAYRILDSLSIAVNRRRRQTPPAPPPVEFPQP